MGRSQQAGRVQLFTSTVSKRCGDNLRCMPRPLSESGRKFIYLVFKAFAEEWEQLAPWLSWAEHVLARRPRTLGLLHRGRPEAR